MHPKEAGRTLARAISLSVWRGLVAWRWLMLIPGFVVGALIINESMEYFFREEHFSRRPDAWDLFPAMLAHDYALLLLALGFLVLVGDSYRRDQEEGAVALSVLRMRSRPLFWIARMGALGVMALCFCGLGLLITLLVGMFVATPLEVWPLLPREAVTGMYPDGGMPVPAAAFFLAGYAAWALWLAGCAIVLLSLFIPHKAGALAVIAVWGVFSIPWIQPRYTGYYRLLGLGYLVSFSKHQGQAPASLGGFFTITGVALVLIAVAGVWRLRREEL